MTIVLPFAAYSINSMYYNNRNHGIRTEARQWQYEVNKVLANYDFEPLRAEFVPGKTGFSVTMIFGYKNFFTKSGHINSKIFDITNCEKALMDLLFNPSNYGSPPFKTSNMNIDDRNVVRLLSKKCEAAEDNVTIKIKLIPIKK